MMEDARMAFSLEAPVPDRCLAQSGLDAGEMLKELDLRMANKATLRPLLGEAVVRAASAIRRVGRARTFKAIDMVEEDTFDQVVKLYSRDVIALAKAISANERLSSEMKTIASACCMRGALVGTVVSLLEALEGHEVMTFIRLGMLAERTA
jgi:hypothetical protein